MLIHFPHLSLPKRTSKWKRKIYLVSTTIGHVLDITKANGAKLSKTMINVNTNS